MICGFWAARAVEVWKKIRPLPSFFLLLGSYCLCEKFKSCDRVVRSNKVWDFVLSPKYCLPWVLFVKLEIAPEKTLLGMITKCLKFSFFVIQRRLKRNKWQFLPPFAFSCPPAKFAKCMRLFHVTCATITASFSLSLFFPRNVVVIYI